MMKLTNQELVLPSGLFSEIEEVEHHLHNRERWWGSNGAATETNAIAITVSVPFIAISGNNTWGTAIPICGTADNPVLATHTLFDPHRIVIADTDDTTPYRVRLIYGTGTSAAAITAGQYSETMFQALSGPLDTGVVDIMMPRILVGWKLWGQVWNASNSSNVDFYWGAHGYVS